MPLFDIGSSMPIPTLASDVILEPSAHLVEGMIDRCVRILVGRVLVGRVTHDDLATRNDRFDPHPEVLSAVLMPMRNLDRHVTPGDAWEKRLEFRGSLANVRLDRVGCGHVAKRHLNGQGHARILCSSCAEGRPVSSRASYSACVYVHDCTSPAHAAPDCRERLHAGGEPPPMCRERRGDRLSGGRVRLLVHRRSRAGSFAELW
jgi:hypothetical protein